jgi:hypothetical protein
MKHLLSTISLSLCLAIPTLVAQPVSAKENPKLSAHAWQQTWQLARQHFPGLAAAEFELVSQTNAQQELEAYGHSKYGFWDAKLLANFWNQSVDETKAMIGKRWLSGGSAIVDLDRSLANARTQAQNSAQQLLLFKEFHTFDDAEVLAKFWGEPTPLDAKLRAERKMISGDGDLVDQLLAEARRPVAQPDFIDNLAGTQWRYNYKGSVFQFDFGQNSIDNFTNGFWKGISWQPNGPNQLRLSNNTTKAAMFITFQSPTSFSGNDWDGSPISGSMIGAVPKPIPPNAGPNTGQIFDVLPRVGEMTTTDRPTFQAQFSSPVDRRSMRFLVDKMDHTPELGYFSNDKKVQWNPSSSMTPGLHNVEVTAIGTNGETLASSWSFSTPAPAQVQPTTMRVSNLFAGEVIASPFRVEGQGIPGSGILVQVEYPKQDILSLLAGATLRFQSKGKVKQDGTFSIPVNAHQVPQGQTMTITVTDSASSPVFTVKCQKGVDRPGKI